MTTIKPLTPDLQHSANLTPQEYAHDIAVRHPEIEETEIAGAIREGEDHLKELAKQKE